MSSWTRKILALSPACPRIFQLTCMAQKEDLAILDLGTGNAVLLVALAQQGYRNLTGSDYSAASIELSRAVLVKHGLTGEVALVVRWGSLLPGLHTTSC